MVSMLSISFFSCEKDLEENNESENSNETLLTQVVTNYVNNTVIATYSPLADKSIGLYDALVALKADPNDGNVQKAADEWISARKYWELSEAFLFGPATDFGIDEHIDTWPIGLESLLELLADNAEIAKMEGANGINYVAGLDAEKLGFHGIEYVLFEGGHTRSANSISNAELVYAVAVAGDLRNKCISLEASWAGKNNVSTSKQTIINEFNIPTTNTNGKSYGEDMTTAGKSGSSYLTLKDAAEEIINGCIDISDEVATMKLGKPYFGEDVNYIESPYSYNSITDFADNIESIRNAWLGGTNASTRKESINTLFATLKPSVNTSVIGAIDNAIAKINAVQNFEINYASTAVGAAIDAVDELTKALESALSELRQ